MAREPQVVVHFREIPNDEEVRDELTQRCVHLGEEFPETTNFELTLESHSTDFQAHCKISGKGTHIAAHADGASTARQAGEMALTKAERELRKEHDKRIFAPRRKAQKERTRRLD